MVAPLDVGALVRAAQQAIHDLRGAATAIEDVTHQVDVVDGEYLISSARAKMKSSVESVSRIESMMRSW